MSRVEQLTVGSLFSGIGGFDLGLERAGMRVVWQVENDAYCRKVLAKHWPDVPCYEDIHDCGAHNLEEVDVICGGFPCQPVSVAGKQLAQDDERWLWPEFARLVGELRPRHVFVENVPGILVRGLGDVLGDLAALGYDAEWGCVSAASVGAPHLRKRIFIIGTKQRRSVADASGRRRQSDELCTRRDVVGLCSEDVAHAASQQDEFGERRNLAHPSQGGKGFSATAGPSGEDVADADSRRRERIGQQERTEQQSERGGELNGRSAVGQLEYAALGSQWDVEPDVGRVANGVPNRVDRLRALGNAIVPQVAEWVGKRIVSAL